MKQLKDGEITPEQAVEDAFPSPFIRIQDISVEDLSVEPLSTGFKVLDDNLFLKEGRPELVVVGAGTSHGKSAFMLQLAANVSQKGPVPFFSLEMDERDIKARLLAPRINTPLPKILGNKVSLENLRKANSLFKDMQLHLCTNGRRDVNYIQQSVYDLCKRVGRPRLIVVDYLQLVRGPTKATRTAEIAEILGNLKSLAKEMRCPVLIGSQINRECERRGKSIEMAKGKADYTPMNSDLMDSSSIEHDADVILFLVRQYQYDRSRPGEADIRVTKNRGGRLFDAIFDFSGELCSFYERDGEVL